jgi:hypothetical protein
MLFKHRRLGGSALKLDVGVALNGQADQAVRVGLFQDFEMMRIKLTLHGASLAQTPFVLLFGERSDRVVV